METITRAQEAARLRALADEIEKAEPGPISFVPALPSAPRPLTHQRRMGDLQSLLQSGPRGQDEVLQYLVNAVAELQDRATLTESSEHT